MRNVIIPALALVALFGTASLAVADETQEMTSSVPQKTSPIESAQSGLSEGNQVHTDTMVKDNVYGGLY